jgi:formylglycine-generating enzyme required for sulfatase activity
MVLMQYHRIRHVVGVALVAALALLAVGCSDDKVATPAPPKKATVVLPKGFVSQESRRVKVVTPKGEKSKEITYYKNSIGMEFVKIPAGEFIMGSPKDELNRNKGEVQHRVKVSKGFYLQSTEVTNRQYRQFKRDHNAKDYNSKSLNDDGQPVVHVSWDDAIAFAKWLSKKEGVTYRLPTESEWEYSCRAGSRGRFYFGEDDASLHKYVNYADKNSSFSWSDKAHDDGYAVSAPVGSFSANPWGLYDMSGNVWEWCSDWSGKYPTGTVTDPSGPRSGSCRVIRGGSWVIFSGYCRSARRQGGYQSVRQYNRGFRLLMILGSSHQP